MSWIIRILICLALIPVQTVMLEHFKVFGVKPDLALVIVFVLGWFRGSSTGLYWGLALGGLLDLFSVGSIGIGLMLKSLVGGIAGVFGKSFFHLSTQVYMGIFLMMSVLHDIAGTLILYGLGGEGFQSIRIEEIIVRALYNVVLGIMVVFLIKNKINPQEIAHYGGAIFSPGKK